MTRSTSPRSSGTDRYRSADHLWSGQPNAQLVAQTADLVPGVALDVGSGEGADAIWLAGRVDVDGADVSTVALERAARHAAPTGAKSPGASPGGQEDLLSGSQDRAFRPGVRAVHAVAAAGSQALHDRAAAAVAPGGTLLVVFDHPDDLHANAALTGRDDMFRSA